MIVVFAPSTAYTNRDLQTGIGTPWEVSYLQDYTLIMKGGNLRGYSAVFSIVPDLQLGMYIHSTKMVGKGFHTISLPFWETVFP